MTHPLESNDHRISPHGGETTRGLLVARTVHNLQNFVDRLSLLGTDINAHGYQLQRDSSGIEYMHRIPREEASSLGEPKRVMLIIPGTLQAPEYYLPHAKAFEDDFDVVVLSPSTLQQRRKGWEISVASDVSLLLGRLGYENRDLILWGESAGGVTQIKLDAQSLATKVILSRTAPPHSPAWRSPLAMATGILSFLAKTLPDSRVIHIARGNQTNGRRYSWQGEDADLEQEERIHMTDLDMQLRDGYYVPVSKQNVATRTKEAVVGHMVSARNATRRRFRKAHVVSQTEALIMFTPDDHIIHEEDLRRLLIRYPNHQLRVIPSVYGHNSFFTSVSRQILAAAAFLAE